MGLTANGVCEYGEKEGRGGHGGTHAEVAA
jgi:hypothetical protein